MASEAVETLLSRFPLRSGVGVYQAQDGVHRVEAVRTLLGFHVHEVKHEDPRLASVETTGGGIDVAGVIDAVRRYVPSLAGVLPQKRRLHDVEDESETPRPRIDPVTVGLRANAVTFLSEVEQDVGPVPMMVEREDAKPDGEERRVQSVLADQVTVAHGKRKLRLTAKVRFGELEAIEAETGLEPSDDHRYEPEPWAVWRASSHHAPFAPKKGVHLRYVLGENEGLAILGTGKWPLAWQVLSWEGEEKAEVLLQAYHLLSVHAVRRLQLTGVDHVTVQGDDTLESDWAELEEAVGHEIYGVDGPVYDAKMVAFGLALAPFDKRARSLNLARSMQEKPSLLAQVPWGEGGFILSLCLCMFLILHDHAAGLKAQVNHSVSASATSLWARGKTNVQLKQDAAVLSREVGPISKYLKREVRFSHALSAVAASLPDSTWLVSVAGADLIWEKNSNKALGQRYLQIQAGAPSVRRGMAPPEINEAVRTLEANGFMKSVLPRVKLTDVNWRQQSGRGFTVFSMTSLPRK